ncbi:unnamed protein product [Meloidogyne enterolobii]|uniref:Uncharacterized protein n=2 Tax=Meloidogyne enterolobii TaxID=390850 RepID=A0ACB0Y6V8_MELEN|nr:unnamed protein product [Meloidogyne enterolobii]
MLFQIICPISLYLTFKLPHNLAVLSHTRLCSTPLKCRHFWWHFSFHPASFF